MEFLQEVLGYLVFSGIEYFALTLLIFSLFRFRPKHYMKEIILISIILDVLSLVIIQTTDNISYYIAPVANVVILTILIKRAIHGKYLATFFKVISGIAILSLTQIIFSFLLSYIGYYQINFLLYSGMSVYIIQLSSSIVLITFSIKTLLENGGFDFSLLKKTSRYLAAIISVLSIIILIILPVRMFNESGFTLKDMFLMLIVCSSIVLLFIKESKKNEKNEYQ